MNKTAQYRKFLAMLLAVLAGASSAKAAEEHARGIVVSIDKARHSLIVSCDAVPGFIGPHGDVVRGARS